MIRYAGSMEYTMTPDLKSFLSEAAPLISDHQWVWDVHMTKFFQLQYWNKIPVEWHAPLLALTTEELNQLPFGFTKEEWPDSLQRYVRNSCSRSLHRTVPHWVTSRAVTMETTDCRKMTPKKIHEVGQMAGVVADVCRRTGCSLVLDIGSGLGYLGQTLSGRCGLMVVGVERERDRVATARERAAVCTTTHTDTANITPDTANTTPDTVNTTPDTANTTSDTANTTPDTANITPDTANTTPDTVNTTPDTANTTSDTANTTPDTANTTSDTANTTDTTIPTPTTTPDTVTSSYRDTLCEVLSTIPRGCHSPSHTVIHLNITDSRQSGHQLAALLDAVNSHCGQRVKVCVVGLHCCGDLAPALIRLFTAHVHPDLCAMVLVGCCYHKMSSTESGKFTNFPMSAHLQCSSLCPPLNVFAMRLAAQETRARWRQQDSTQHSAHEKNVSYRAVVQAVCGDAGQRRNVGAKRFNNFTTYSKHISRELQSPQVERGLVHYHCQHSQYSAFVEPFTALQVCMQGVVESVVLADRAMFLRERGFTPCLLPLFDDLISPRNIAIVTTSPGNNL